MTGIAFDVPGPGLSMKVIDPETFSASGFERDAMREVFSRPGIGIHAM